MSRPQNCRHGNGCCGELYTPPDYGTESPLPSRKRRLCLHHCECSACDDVHNERDALRSALKALYDAWPQEAGMPASAFLEQMKLEGLFHD